MHTLDLPLRSGPRPDVIGPRPHAQVSQNAPVELQEELFGRMRSLAGVRVVDSHVSVPGARAVVLEADGALGPAEAFMAATEFAHIHPHHDGSLHVTLPESMKDEVEAAYRGIRHPASNIILVYGPRDREELEVVWSIVRMSHAYASGELSRDG